MKSKYFSRDTEATRLQAFQEIFEDDTDSFFTSSVACCSRCSDAFAQAWPGTFHSDEKMLTMDLDDFVESSRLQDVFHPEEIQHLSKQLKCPNCGQTIVDYFIIYERPFPVPDGFLRDLDEIARIAARTPFLLLEHPFAKRTFTVVKQLAADTDAVTFDATYFRARKFEGQPLEMLADFGPPPREKVSEGRFNHASHPMLYLALDQDTAFREVVAAEARYYVAALRLKAELKILDLSLREDAKSESDVLIQCLARSALCAAPRTGQGWLAKEYVFTRFVADCARHAGFHAIKYGSTKAYGANVVLLEPPAHLSEIAAIERVALLPTKIKKKSAS